MSKPRWSPKVTVAAIIERQGRYLLIEEHTSAGLQLNTPAGHLEPGESLQDAAVREALEETGRQFQPQAVVGVYLAAADNARGHRDTWVRVAYCGVAGEPLPGCRLDHGIVRTLWMSPDEIRASQDRHRSTLVWRCVHDHLQGRRFPLDVVQADATALPGLTTTPGG